MNRAILSLAVAMFSISPLISAIDLPSKAIAETPKQTNSNSFPTQGASIQAFVPKGWKVESKVEGDLNADRRPDVVLRLIDNSKGDHDRVLLVLQKQSNGQWQRIGFAPKVLLCSTCGGMLGSIQLKIENGVILVDQLRGSREAVNTLHRFWIDKTSKKVVLIGLDVDIRDRATGDEIRESRNFLSGQKITEKYRANRQQDGIELVSRQRSTIPKTTSAIETVDY
ncbi:MAG: hypothetical protein KME18_11650 [Phormidium tanganyikae FI6-MK23]|jgi:hypothetical protein|nr:hypothetical protein [Phormidium tanganyikae FI6-MK23]